MIVSGWGEIEDGSKPDDLRVATVKAIDDASESIKTSKLLYCTKAYLFEACKEDWSYIDNEHICTERPSDGTEAGPCFVTKSKVQFFQI